MFTPSKQIVSLVPASVKYGMKAYRAAKVIQNQYRRYRASKMRKQAIKRIPRRSKFSGVSTGYYVGKFRKPSKKGITVIDKFQSQGAGTSIENHGKVQDADVIYVGHSTLCRTEIVKTIIRSLLKKIFALGIKFEASSYDQEIPYNTYNVGAEYASLQWVWIMQDGSISAHEYVLPNNNTHINGITDFMMNSGYLGAQLLSAVSGDGSFPQFQVLERFRFCSVTYGNQRNLLAELNMNNQVIDLMFKSSIKIQNRTKSAETGSSSTEVIDNQPIVGYRYVGYGAGPKSKQMFYFSSLTDQHGVYLNSATNLNAFAPVAGGVTATEYKEPLRPKIFSNVYQSSRVSLQPGEIKRGNISYRLKGYFNNILSKLVVKATGGGNQISGPGKFEIYSFEEVINTGVDNPITVQYEQQLDIYCQFYKGKSPIVPNKFVSNTVNHNLP